MSLDVLDELETKVREAGEVITALRQRTGELEQRIEELESALTEAGDDGEVRWQGERAELRARVETLVTTLEGLIEG